MNFVTESMIDACIDRYEVEENYLNDIRIMLDTAPAIDSYLQLENITLLTPDEFALLEYLITIIYHSSAKVIGKHPIVEGKKWEEMEEKNWEEFNSTTKKKFSTIMDSFFENYYQEDLLALVEDSVIKDEDNTVSSVGSEIIVVACKSLIDTLHADYK